jgi:hypothetical protein
MLLKVMMTEAAKRGIHWIARTTRPLIPTVKDKSMKNDNDDRVKSGYLLGVAVKLSGIAASLALLLSIVYDYGYFESLGITFSDVPSSISDHLRTGLIWFPALFFAVVGATIFELITVRIERGMSEDEIITSSPVPEKTKRFRERLIKLLPWIAGCIIVSYILAGDYFVSGLPYAFCLIWFRVAPWLSNHPRIFQRRPRYLRAAIFWIPALFIFLLGKGYTDGKNLILLNKSNYEITLKDQQNNSQSIILIKQLEKGLLFKKPNEDKISFEKWENVQRVDKRVDQSLYQGLLVRVFGVSLPVNKGDTKN